MITKRKLEVYEKYHGDIDVFGRLPAFGFDGVTEADFFEICDVLQDARLVNRGLASEEYSNTARQKVINHCDSQETIEYLNLLANTTDY